MAREHARLPLFSSLLFSSQLRRLSPSPLFSGRLRSTPAFLSSPDGQGARQLARLLRTPRLEPAFASDLMASDFLTKLPLPRPLLRPCGSLQFCSSSGSPRFGFCFASASSSSPRLPRTASAPTSIFSSTAPISPREAHRSGSSSASGGPAPTLCSGSGFLASTSTLVPPWIGLRFGVGVPRRPRRSALTPDSRSHEGTEEFPSQPPSPFLSPPLSPIPFLSSPGIQGSSCVSIGRPRRPRSSRAGVGLGPPLSASAFRIGLGLPSPVSASAFRLGLGFPLVRRKAQKRYELLIASKQPPISRHLFSFPHGWHINVGGERGSTMSHQDNRFSLPLLFRDGLQEVPSFREQDNWPVSFGPASTSPRTSLCSYGLLRNLARPRTAASSQHLRTLRFRLSCPGHLRTSRLHLGCPGRLWTP